MKLLLKDFRYNKLETKVLEDETEELEDTDYCIIYSNEKANKYLMPKFLPPYFLNVCKAVHTN